MAPGPSSSVFIRDATDADVPAIARLYVDVFTRPPWNEAHEVAATEEWLRPHIQPFHVHTLLAVDASSALLGFVIASAYGQQQFLSYCEQSCSPPPGGWPDVPGRLSYVWELAVRPDHRRRGVGTALMRYALERLRRDGADGVLLHTSERSAASVALYRRLGFRRLPIEEHADRQAGSWLLALDPDASYAAEAVADPPACDQLGRYWQWLWRGLDTGAGEATLRDAFTELAGLYGAPGRHYHTLVHVRDCLLELLWAHHAARRSPLVQLALFFHDCIYDPRRSDNEARSADYAAATTRSLGLQPADVDTVTHLIMATHHLAAPSPDAARDPDAALTADADLAIFGRSPADFARYESAIRREYAHVPDHEFRAGRAAVLRRLLAQPRIYATTELFTRYEHRARANLTRSLSALSKAPR